MWTFACGSFAVSASRKRMNVGELVGSTRMRSFTPPSACEVRAMSLRTASSSAHVAGWCEAAPAVIGARPPRMGVTERSGS